MTVLENAFPTLLSFLIEMFCVVCYSSFVCLKTHSNRNKVIYYAYIVLYDFKKIPYDLSNLSVESRSYELIL